MGTFKTNNSKKADTSNKQLIPRPNSGNKSINTKTQVVAPSGGHMSKGKKSSSYMK